MNVLRWQRTGGGVSDGAQEHDSRSRRIFPKNKYGFKPAPESQVDRPDAGAHRRRHDVSDDAARQARFRLEKVNFAEIMKKVGAEEAKPRTKAEIVALLKESGEKFAASPRGAGRFVPRRGHHVAARAQSRRRGRVSTCCSAAKEHEMHHRAQLMMMQRMIGIVPHLTRAAQERMARFQAQQNAEQPQTTR